MRLVTTFVQNTAPNDPDLSYINRARFQLSVADGHGADGVGIESMEVRNRRLFVTLTSGATLDLGEVYSDDNLPLASDTRRGIASFNAEDFLIEAGRISLKKVPGYGQGIVLKQGVGIKIEDLPTGAKRISHGETTAVSAPYTDQFGHIILDLRDEFHPKGGRPDLDFKAKNITVAEEVVAGKGLRSADYISGAFGEGGAFRKDPVSGKWIIEGDSLHLRESLHVPELILDKVRAVKGALIVSSGSGKIASVVEGDTTYILTLEDDQNTFVAGDFIRCQVFSGTGFKFYWVPVTEVAANTLTVPKSDFGVAVPVSGDELVQFGNDHDRARQSAIYITASDSGAPMIDVLDGISTRSLNGCMKVRLGNLDGITDTTLNPHGYGLYALNCFLSGSFKLTNGMTLDEYVDQAGAQIERNVITNITAEGGKIELSVKSEVDKVQIGGANLILNSMTNETSNIYGFGVRRFSGNRPLEVGKTYTLVANGRIDQQAANDGKCMNIYLGGLQYLATISSLTDTTVSATFTVSDLPEANRIDIAAYMFPVGGSRQGTVTLNWYALYEGNKAPLTWSPAPEDMASKTELEAKIAVTDGHISAAVSGIQVGTTNFALNTTGDRRWMAWGDNVQCRYLLSESTPNGVPLTIRFTTTNVGAKPEAFGIGWGTREAWSEEYFSTGYPVEGKTFEYKLSKESGQTALWIYFNTDTTVQHLSVQSGNKPTDWCPAPEDVDAKIDGIQVGGTNLLPDSEIITVSAVNGFGASRYTTVDLIQGETYTLSYEETDIVISNSFPQFYIWNGDWGTVQNLGVINVKTITFPFSLPTGRYSLTVYNHIYPVAGYLKRVKLERGNKPTDWSPAPEDVPDKLLRTGIDIELGKITLDSGTGGAVEVKNGTQTAALFQNGRIKAEFIDVDNLTARRVDAVAADGSHILINPEDKRISFRDQNNRPVMSLFPGDNNWSPMISLSPNGRRNINITHNAVIMYPPDSLLNDVVLDGDNLAYIEWNNSTGRFIAKFGKDGIYLLPGSPVDIPGPLAAGRVLKGGGYNGIWGSKINYTNTAVKNSTGTYQLSHNIGHTNYYISTTIISPDRNWTGTCVILNKQDKYCEIGVVDMGGRWSDCSFEFMLMGDN